MSISMSSTFECVDKSRKQKVFKKEKFSFASIKINQFHPTGPFLAPKLIILLN